MMGFVIVLHAIACLALVVIILMQSGRGGGLTEAFSSAESMFGAKTNEFLTRGTTVFAVIFLVTSLSLAFMSSRKGKSIMPNDLVVEETAKEIPADNAEDLVDAAKDLAEKAANKAAKATEKAMDDAKEMAE